MWTIEEPMSKRGRFDKRTRTQAFDRAKERGAVLVETAIMLPVIILITFGMIEFSSAYQSSSTAASAARSAARTASAEAKLPGFATDAAAAAATALRLVPADEPVEMWVYRANAQGYPGADGNTDFNSCTTKCIKYTWVPSSRSFNTASPGGDGWSASDQQACSPSQWDSVGVFVKLRHEFITRLFGATIDLTDHAVFRLEPAPTQLCT
jgi:Flp pilus assembly protein TadG